MTQSHHPYLVDYSSANHNYLSPIIEFALNLRSEFSIPKSSQ